MKCFLDTKRCQDLVIKKKTSFPGCLCLFDYFYVPFIAKKHSERTTPSSSWECKSSIPFPSFPSKPNRTLENQEVHQRTPLFFIGKLSPAPPRRDSSHAWPGPYGQKSQVSHGRCSGSDGFHHAFIHPKWWLNPFKNGEDIHLRKNGSVLRKGKTTQAKTMDSHASIPEDPSDIPFNLFLGN